MQKKIIGLTGPSSFSQDCKNMIEELLGMNYVTLDHNDPDNLYHWLNSVDAVILAGGVDIHPTIYGKNVWNYCNLSNFDLSRDIRELRVIKYCLESSKPMLGICRGHQLIGIKHGIKLCPDISSSFVCHQGSKAGIKLDVHEPMHSVRIISKDIFNKMGIKCNSKERNVLYENYLGGDEDCIWVNSFHHQALIYDKKMSFANNLRVVGISRVELDICTENIELMAGNNFVSCQWHPEYDWKVNSYSESLLLYFKSLVG